MANIRHYDKLVTDNVIFKKKTIARLIFVALPSCSGLSFDFVRRSEFLGKFN
jgi:hypothetical protein